jgi:hypothetical protein
MKNLATLAAGLFLCGSFLGCQNEKLGKPDVFHPRSADVQQKRALRYDPYPDTAGPDMSGTRPREYASPPAEVSRARWGQNERGSSYSNSQRWGTNGN